MDGRKLRLYIRCTIAATFLLYGRYLAAALVSKRKGRSLKWVPARYRRYITCPSGNVLYVEIDGPVNSQPVVFIHGINADHTQWYYQRASFRDKYQLIFISLPAHFNNLGYKQDIATLTADLNYVLGQLNVNNAVLYGHSMGGALAIEYSSAYPQGRVKALVLHSAPYTDPLYLNNIPRISKYLRNPVVIPLLQFVKRHPTLFNFFSYAGFLNGMSVILFRYVHFTGRQTAAEMLYATSMAPRNDAGAMAESLLQLFEYDASARLQDIHMSVLVISAKNDRLINQATGEYLHRHIKGSSLVVVPGGHQSMIEEHELVNGSVSDFLEEVKNWCNLA